MVNRVAPDFRCNTPIRDRLKLWTSEDYNAGLIETILLPGMNVTKRLLLYLTVNIDVAISPTLVPDNILPVIDRIEIETAGEDRLINLPFTHLWHKTNIRRGCISDLTPFTANEADQTLTAMVEIDFSDLQDFGLDSGQLDQLRLRITWAAATVLGSDVTINSGSVAVFYDERIPGATINIHPFMNANFFNKTLATISNGRVELPKGKRMERLYLRLLDGTTPIEWTSAFLPRITIEYDGDVIWGPFDGDQAVKMWHFMNGFEKTGWADSMFYRFGVAAGEFAADPYDLSYIVVDFIDVVTRQLSHAVDSGRSDQFNIVYDFAVGALTNPVLEIYYDYHFTGFDRLQNDASKISRSLPHDVREGLMNLAQITKAPRAAVTRPVQVSPDVVRLMKAGSGLDLIATTPSAPKGRSSVLGTGAKAFSGGQSASLNIGI